MRAAFFAFALLAACAPTIPATPPVAEAGAAIHLSGTKWARADDGNAMPHPATLEFEGARASGYTGCNRWFASVTQNGEELRFGSVGTTRMACQTEMQSATERSFLAVLEATRYAHYDRDALVLLDTGQNQIARFESTLPE